MNTQKQLFQLPDDLHYLNGAYMSPLLKSAEAAGIAGLQLKRNPTEIAPADYFTGAATARERFGKIINAPARQIALIPSVSYGMAAAVQNIPPQSGTHAITLSDEFPSGYYSIEDWCNRNQKSLKVIQAPALAPNRGETWNAMLLDAIQPDTCAVVMSSINWSDGTRFNLNAIGERCRQMGALLIVDGTQSVGALPLDITDTAVDALICASYKWLLGPYSMGIAYFSERFNAGQPLEHAWINKPGAADFSTLTQYRSGFQEGAARYNVGEFANPALMPVLNTGLQQLLDWQVSNIPGYCENLIRPLIELLQEKGIWMENPSFRCSHLFGIYLPANEARTKLLASLREKKIIVSLRGEAIRISPNLYNTTADIAALMEAISTYPTAD